MDVRWSDPIQVLDAVTRIVDTSRPDTLAAFSCEIADLVPHDIMAIRTADCARTPVKVVGEDDAAAQVTSAELRNLETTAAHGRGAYVVEGILAGRQRQLAVVTAAPGHSRGATLVVGLTTTVDPDALAVIEQLWTIASAVAVERAENTGADLIATNRAAAVARTNAVDDVTRTQDSVLTGLLAVLRSSDLDDPQARRRAIDLAAAALLDVRAAPDDTMQLASIPADHAFANLTHELDPLARHGATSVEFVGPQSAAPLPQDIATTSRAATRALILTATARTGVTRTRAAWAIDDATLRISVRDDAESTETDLARGIDDDIADRIRALRGQVNVESIDGWGTTATVEIPLQQQDPAPLGLVDTLAPRELEIVQAISRGMRNGQIADQLRLSEHTVKFHVRNILKKLDVDSRGEAAALIRTATK